MIKEVTKFQADDASWRDYDTAEAAKDAARKKTVEKYLLEGDAPSQWYGAADWMNTAKWYSKAAHMKGKLDSHQTGWYEGRRSAIDALIKFYPDIKSKLDEIDSQKVKETK